MKRRAFLGFLATLPFVAKALPSIVASAPATEVAPAAYAWKEVVVPLTFNGFPIVTDPLCPPGMMFYVTEKTRRGLEERLSEQLFS